MEAPMEFGASVVDAPPGTPGGTASRRGDDDRALLDAVRGGDVDAYGALYSRHVAAVRRLARRMAVDRHEADDIVGDVFANTLRAIRRGRGPRDDAEAYLLRSVRHTAGKLRSRKDTGRSQPVPIERLDRAVETAVHLRSDVEIALTHLPDRHRNVLWSTCVEGRPASEVAAADGVDVSCVTSLTLRARRALGRSYLLQRTVRPEPTEQCGRIRAAMPGCLRDEVGPSTTAAVHDHIDDCDVCRDVYEEMGRLDQHLRSVTLVGLLVGVLQGWLRVGAPLVATLSRQLASFAMAGAVVTGAITSEPPVHDADPIETESRSGSGRRPSRTPGPMSDPPRDLIGIRPVDRPDRPDATTTRTIRGDDPDVDELLHPDQVPGRSPQVGHPDPPGPDLSVADPTIVDPSVLDPSVLDPAVEPPSIDLGPLDPTIDATVDWTEHTIGGAGITVTTTFDLATDTASGLPAAASAAVGRATLEFVEVSAQVTSTVGREASTHGTAVVAEGQVVDVTTDPIDAVVEIVEIDAVVDAQEPEPAPVAAPAPPAP